MGKALNFFNKYINNVIGIVVLLIIATLIFMYTYPFNVATFKSVTVLNEVKAGGQIKYELDYCRYVGDGIEIHPRRFLIREGANLSNAIELGSNPTLETTGGTGCHKSEPIELPVEIGIRPGRYQLMIQIRYCIFPGRCIPVEGRSNFFDISQPSIPDQLTQANTLLEDIRDYLGEEATANTTPLLEITRPEQPEQSQPTENPSSQYDNEGLLETTLNGTTTTVDRLTKMLGL